MKRFVLVLILMIGISAVRAYDYPYLVFQTTDGSSQSIEAEKLVLTFSGSQLVATNGTENLTLTVSDLSKMFFSSTTSGVSQISEADGEVEVFTLSGIRMGSYSSVAQALKSLRSGIYVVSSKEKTIKITVK